jgi:phospho-N-acetylmuramoyl-pentapeptide-transferase
VGTVLYFHPGVTVRTDTSTSDILEHLLARSCCQLLFEENQQLQFRFLKNNEFDYAEVLAWTGRRDMKNGPG